MKNSQSRQTGRFKAKIVLTVLLTFFSSAAGWAETPPLLEWGAAHIAQKPYSDEAPAASSALPSADTSTGWLMEASALSSPTPAMVSTGAISTEVRIEAFSLSSNYGSVFEIVLLYNQSGKKGLALLNETRNEKAGVFLADIKKTLQKREAARMSETLSESSVNPVPDAWTLIAQDLKQTTLSGGFGPSAVLVEISSLHGNQNNETGLTGVLAPLYNAGKGTVHEMPAPGTAMTEKELNTYIDSFFQWNETEEVEIEVYRPELFMSAFEKPSLHRPKNMERIKVRQEALVEIIRILQHKWLPGSASRFSSSLAGGSQAVRHEIAGIRG